MCKEMTSTEYINEKIMYGADISKVVEIRNFALLWNMFELLILKGNSDFCNIIDDIIKGKTNELIKLSKEDKINKMFIYFEKRYGENGQFDFNDLNLEKGRISKVKELLNNSSGSIMDKTYVVFHIIRRIRNNFFHGSKEFHELPQNEDLFKEINLFLIPYIEKAYILKYY